MRTCVKVELDVCVLFLLGAVVVWSAFYSEVEVSALKLWWKKLQLALGQTSPPLLYGALHHGIVLTLARSVDLAVRWDSEG